MMEPSGWTGKKLGCQLGNAPPIFFSVLPKRKRAVHGPKEKNAFGRNFAQTCKVAVRESSETVPAKPVSLLPARAGPLIRASLAPRVWCGGKPGWSSH